MTIRICDDDPRWLSQASQILRDLAKERGASRHRRSL